MNDNTTPQETTKNRVDPGMTEASSHDLNEQDEYKPTGPIVGIVLIMIIIVLGAGYLLMHEEETLPALEEEQSELDEMEQELMEAEIEELEQELDELEEEMANIEAEAEGEVQAE